MDGSILVLSLAWLAMMAAMMAPSVWPWIRAFRRICNGLTPSFAAGYLAAWLPYSVAAAICQHAIVLQGSMANAVLLGAGLFQFTPLKGACLRHCRNPMTYFLSRWKNEPAGAFRMGFQHGLFCVGCCWALMATALAVGVMNMWWMAALAGATFIEQVTPRGEHARVAIGVALIAAAISISSR